MLSRLPWCSQCRSPFSAFPSLSGGIERHDVADDRKSTATIRFVERNEGKIMTRAKKVRQALLAAGHADSIAEFPAGTRTAEDAAASVGCSVAQIAKSIVFRAGEDVVLVIEIGRAHV